MDALAAAGVDACLTGGFAVDAWTGRVAGHADIDLLVPESALGALERLAIARDWPLRRLGEGACLDTSAGPCDLLVVRRGGDGLWRPTWRRGRVPWPPGQPFGARARLLGREVAAASPAAILLRLVCDTPDLPKARREAALLARTLSAPALVAVERWRVLHLREAPT